MTILFQHYQLSLMLTVASGVLVGLWVLIQKRSSRVAQLFCLYSLGVGFWSWCQAQAGSSPTPTASLWWGRAMFYAVIGFPVLLTNFFATFLGIAKRRPSLVGWTLVAAFLPFLSSDLFLYESGPLGFLPSFPRAGPLFLPFNLIWLGWFIYAMHVLRCGLRGPVQPIRRQQVYILFIAFLFGYVTGCTNYLYFYGICITPLQPFACYGVPIAYLVITYGVFVHHLFDIRVVIRKGLIYSILGGILTAVYFCLVLLAEKWLQGMVGYRSLVTSVVAGFAIALGFAPLKDFVQRIVDRLFFHAPREQLIERLERLERKLRDADKLKAISLLTAGMAHEIKNPLTAIKTFTSFLREKGSDPAFRETFQRLVAPEVDRIERLVRHVLEFAKPHAVQRQSADVPELLDETLELLSSDCLVRGVKVERSYESHGLILANPSQLRQVFLNLFLNNLDAMPGGGQLAVSTGDDRAELTVIIEDAGVGISEEHLKRICDPFFTTKPNGTGLGLSIVRGLVRNHGGTLTFDSQLGLGTRCTLKFPLIQSAPQPEIAITPQSTDD